jgi:beta-1,4-galactosyltransferase 2
MAFCAPLLLGMALACTVPVHIGIIIPYRNRDHHASVLIPHLLGYRRAHFPCDYFHVWVVEQDNLEPFNRAWLGNVGLSLALNATVRFKCIVFHDVDLKPAEGVPYTSCEAPVQLSSELEHFNWGVPYATSAGGVVSMRPEHWEQVNGFSNDYVGWGGEDDDLYHRIRMAGLLVASGSAIDRPKPGTGRFHTIDESKANHPRAQSHEFYAKSTAILKDMASGSARWKTDGLNSVAYRVTKTEVRSRGVVWVHAKHPFL